MDKYRDCQLKDVRLEGVPGEKMDRFLQFRVLSDFAKKDIFGEARSPIERRDDDEGMPAGGMWRGEFWGKLMLSTASVVELLYVRVAGFPRAHLANSASDAFGHCIERVAHGGKKPVPQSHHIV